MLTEQENQKLNEIYSNEQIKTVLNNHGTTWIRLAAIPLCVIKTPQTLDELKKLSVNQEYYRTNYKDKRSIDGGVRELMERLSIRKNNLQYKHNKKDYFEENAGTYTITENGRKQVLEFFQKHNINICLD